MKAVGTENTHCTGVKFDIFLKTETETKTLGCKTKTKTKGLDLKTKTKTVIMHLETISRPSHVSRLPIPA